LPAVLRVPLSQPLFLLGTLFVLVVLFLPGGLAGAVGRLGPHRVEAGRDRLEVSGGNRAGTEEPVGAPAP
jgi:branched-chain amino acid transport system permease protein